MGKFDNRSKSKWQKHIDIRFDMVKKPRKQLPLLMPIVWLLSSWDFLFSKLKIHKSGIQGIKPPFLILSNHCAFKDFKVLNKAIFPRRANYVVAIDGFIHMEWLLRLVGGIGKRKFTNDTILIKNMMYVLRTLKQILVLYPEARYSHVGIQSRLPDSLGKFIKLAKVPVLMMNMNGNYLNKPVWNLRSRTDRFEAHYYSLFSQDDIATLSVEEINTSIREAFIYNDYQWQLQNNIQITKPFRAEGLHKVLYHCPHCDTEFCMDSLGAELFCTACNTKYFMETNGVLSIISSLPDSNKHSGFSHIPDWYNWQRVQVRNQISSGIYCVEDDVLIDSLPNSKGFISLGQGRLIHSMQGFYLEGTKFGTAFEERWAPQDLYSVHIEFNYNSKGDAVDLCTLDDCYYCYPINLKNVITKIHFATEELFDYYQRDTSNT